MTFEPLTEETATASRWLCRPFPLYIFRFVRIFLHCRPFPLLYFLLYPIFLLCRPFLLYISALSAFFYFAAHSLFDIFCFVRFFYFAALSCFIFSALSAFLSPSGDLGIGLVWDNPTPPHPTGQTFWSHCWNPLQTELNYLGGVLSCSQDDIRWF